MTVGKVGFLGDKTVMLEIVLGACDLKESRTLGLRETLGQVCSFFSPLPPSPPDQRQPTDAYKR
jgi:hypothetical protein